MELGQEKSVGQREGTHLGHALAAELELDRLDVARRVDLHVVLALGEAGAQRSSQARHVVDLAVNEDEVRRHDLQCSRVSKGARERKRSKRASERRTSSMNLEFCV